MLRRRWPVLIVLVVFGLAVLAIVSDRQPTQATRLTALGRVELERGAATRAVTEDIDLALGDRLRLEDTGYGVVTFPDGSSTALEPGHQYQVVELVSQSGRHLYPVPVPGN